MKYLKTYAYEFETIVQLTRFDFPRASFEGDRRREVKGEIIVNAWCFSFGILFADRKFDITKDIINGLNKRYKPAPAKKDEKKDEKK